MRELKVYDKGRKPPEWLAHLGSGQYAVFFSDSATDVPLDGEGAPFPSPGDTSCFVFDSLAEARKYAAERADRSPRLRGRIFDAAGCANPPVLIVEHPAVAARRETSPRSVRRVAALAIVLAGSSAALLWADYAHHWTLIYPTILALNLALGAARVVQWVFSARETQRARERAGEERLKAEAKSAGS